MPNGDHDQELPKPLPSRNSRLALISLMSGTLSVLIGALPWIMPALTSSSPLRAGMIENAYYILMPLLGLIAIVTGIRQVAASRLATAGAVLGVVGVMIWVVSVTAEFIPITFIDVYYNI